MVGLREKRQNDALRGNLNIGFPWKATAEWNITIGNNLVKKKKESKLKKMII